MAGNIHYVDTMKIFVINLPDDAKRKASIQHQANDLGLTVEFVEAVNGKELSKNDINRLSTGFENNGMTLGELGCSLSHIKIYEKIVSEDIGLALVLEDDAKLPSELSSVYELIKIYNNKHNNRPTVYLLNKTNEYIDTLKTKLSSKYSLANVIDSDYAYGYIINKAGAIKLLDFLTPVWIEADKWRFMQMNGIIKLKAVIPPVISVTALSEDSSLESERSERVYKRLSFFDSMYKKRNFNTKLRLFFWRIFIRSWVKRVRP